MMMSSASTLRSSVPFQTPPISKPGEQRRPKYLGLQVARLLAAGLVLVTHGTFYTSERLSRGFYVWRQGAAGVDLFFVLSGFVMVYSSTRLFSDPDGWKVFAERRIVRIVPIYWIATTIKVAIMVLTAGLVLHSQLSLTRLICSYFFLPSRSAEGEITPILSVGWTLIFEMFFYFLFALALYLRRNVYYFTGSILAILAVGSYFRSAQWPAPSFYLQSITLEFFLGMLIAGSCLLGVRLGRRVAILLLFPGFFFLLYPWPKVHAPQLLLTGVPAACIIWSLASLEGMFEGTPRWVLYLADASYAIYLFHPLVAPFSPLMLARLHVHMPWLAVTGCVMLGLGAGTLIHRFLEVPITNYCRDHFRVRGRKVVHQAV